MEYTSLVWEVTILVVLWSIVTTFPWALLIDPYVLLYLIPLIHFNGWDGTGFSCLAFRWLIRSRSSTGWSVDKLWRSSGRVRLQGVTSLTDMLCRGLVTCVWSLSSGRYSISLLGFKMACYSFWTWFWKKFKTLIRSTIGMVIKSRSWFLYCFYDSNLFWFEEVSWKGREII